MILRLSLLTATLLLFFSTNAYGQLYSYSFSGTVKDSAALAQSVQEIEWVEKCKLLLKPEKPGGIVLFRLKPHQVTYDERGKLNQPQPLVVIKEYLLEEGLELQELTRLKD